MVPWSQERDRGPPGWLSAGGRTLLVCAVYSRAMDRFTFAPIRFVWNATRGYRLSPWRSPYLRWRIETYSGKKAETLTAGDIFQFAWESRWDLLQYLRWTGDVQREAHRRG